MGYWDPFNNWWREYVAQHDKRPKVNDMKKWYDANAEQAWGGQGPTWEETKKHSKGMRRIEEVSEYFREYRRGRKRRAGGYAPDSFSSGSDSDGDTPGAKQTKRKPKTARRSCPGTSTAVASAAAAATAAAAAATAASSDTTGVPFPTQLPLPLPLPTQLEVQQSPPQPPLTVQRYASAPHVDTGAQAAHGSGSPTLFGMPIPGLANFQLVSWFSRTASLPTLPFPGHRRSSVNLPEQLEQSLPQPAAPPRLGLLEQHQHQCQHLQQVGTQQPMGLSQQHDFNKTADIYPQQHQHHHLLPPQQQQLHREQQHPHSQPHAPAAYSQLMVASEHAAGGLFSGSPGVPSSAPHLLAAPGAPPPEPFRQHRLLSLQRERFEHANGLETLQEDIGAEAATTLDAPLPTQGYHQHQQHQRQNGISGGNVHCGQVGVAQHDIGVGAGGDYLASLMEESVAPPAGGPMQPMRQGAAPGPAGLSGTGVTAASAMAPGPVGMDGVATAGVDTAAVDGHVPHQEDEANCSGAGAAEYEGGGGFFGRRLFSRGSTLRRVRSLFMRWASTEAPDGSCPTPGEDPAASSPLLGETMDDGADLPGGSGQQQLRPPVPHQQQHQPDPNHHHHHHALMGRWAGLLGLAPSMGGAEQGPNPFGQTTSPVVSQSAGSTGGGFSPRAWLMGRRSRQSAGSPVLTSSGSHRLQRNASITSPNANPHGSPTRNLTRWPSLTAASPSRSLTGGLSVVLRPLWGMLSFRRSSSSVTAAAAEAALAAVAAEEAEAASAGEGKFQGRDMAVDRGAPAAADGGAAASIPAVVAGTLPGGEYADHMMAPGVPLGAAGGTYFTGQGQGLGPAAGDGMVPAVDRGTSGASSDGIMTPFVGAALQHQLAAALGAPGPDGLLAQQQQQQQVPPLPMSLLAQDGDGGAAVAGSGGSDGAGSSSTWISRHPHGAMLGGPYSTTAPTTTTTTATTAVSNLSPYSPGGYGAGGDSPSDSPLGLQAEGAPPGGTGYVHPPPPESNAGRPVVTTGGPGSGRNATPGRPQHPAHPTGVTVTGDSPMVPQDEETLLTQLAPRQASMPAVALGGLGGGAGCVDTDMAGVPLHQQQPQQPQLRPRPQSFDGLFYAPTGASGTDPRQYEYAHGPYDQYGQPVGPSPPRAAYVVRPRVIPHPHAHMPPQARGPTPLPHGPAYAPYPYAARPHPAALPPQAGPPAGGGLLWPRASQRLMAFWGEGYHTGSATAPAPGQAAAAAAAAPAPGGMPRFRSSMGGDMHPQPHPHAHPQQYPQSQQQPYVPQQHQQPQQQLMQQQPYAPYPQQHPQQMALHDPHHQDPMQQLGPVPHPGALGPGQVPGDPMQPGGMREAGPSRLLRWSNSFSEYFRQMGWSR